MIKTLEPELHQIRHRKIYCDMSRICELEDAVVEWYDSRYFQRPDELLNISYLE
jgi:hypothetical protein